VRREPEPRSGSRGHRGADEHERERHQKEDSVKEREQKVEGESDPRSERGVSIFDQSQDSDRCLSYSVSCSCSHAMLIGDTWILASVGRDDR